MPGSIFVRNGNRIHPTPAVCRRPPTPPPPTQLIGPLTIVFDYHCQRITGMDYRVRFKAMAHPEPTTPVRFWTARKVVDAAQFAFTIEYRPDQDNYLFTINHSAIPQWHSFEPIAWHQDPRIPVDSHQIEQHHQDPYLQTLTLRVLA